MPDQTPNARFTKWVAHGRMLAERNGLPWTVPVMPDGSVDTAEAWDMTKACGAAPPPSYRLTDLGLDAGILKVMNARLDAEGVGHVSRAALSDHWQDFIKAGIAHQAFSAKNAPAYVVTAFGRSLRVLATGVSLRSGANPWQTSADDIRWALDLAEAAQTSGKLRELVAAAVRNVVDVHALFDAAPFSHLLHGDCRKGLQLSPRALRNLDERVGAEKLPEAEAFWELTEIVFTKQPQTFVDRLRFAQIKLMFICGLRVTETATIPADWRRDKQYVDSDGRPAAVSGGISTAMMLRHFAAKQQGFTDNSVELVEAFQYVPTQFEDTLIDVLDEIRDLTAPLRDRLRLQVATGRHLPELDPNGLISVVDAYSRLSGNPIVCRDEPEELMTRYRRTHEAEVLEQIRQHQQEIMSCSRATHPKVAIYWAKQKESPPLFRTNQGRVAPDRTRMIDCFFRVSELEEWISTALVTKLSDVDPLPRAGDDPLPVHELLFLMAKRALIDGRNEGVCDLTRCFAVGRVTAGDVIIQLDGRENGIFARYGETPEARALSLNTHSLRHAQNTALFSAGLSDAIITKRFNRRSVAQSYVYDHRSLAERLSAVALPKAAEALPDKVRTVARMLLSGQVRTPIADEFKRVQRKHGDDRAYEFLAAEADGFHATPYGHCINGFTQEPCPKHLECFSGCNHFVNTGLDRNRANVKSLIAKIERALVAIRERKDGAGRDNQIQHAETHLANLRKLLTTPEGERPFPDGRDLSRPIKPMTVFDA